MSTKNDAATANAKRIPMITTARVGWEKDRIQELVLKAKKTEHKLFHVVGTAFKAVVKPSKSYEGRESVEFQGTFMAIDAETGARFKANKLYLPGILEMEIASAMQNGEAARLSATITAEYSDGAPSSYAFGAITHGEDNTVAFDDLLALIPGLNTKALEAPKGNKKK